jgi:SAM-dependent methyltransferase
MPNTCPLCSSVRVTRSALYSKILNLPGNCESAVFVCRTCDARFLSPYISEERLGALYGESYFTGVSEDEGGEDIPSSNSDYESEFARARLGKFNETLSLLLQKLPSAKSILDIGAATGDFLFLAQNRGLLVSGIELSSYAAAKAKAKYGFVFHQSNLVLFQGYEKYDLIHLNHVFEHFESPHQALERISTLLNEDGLIYVEVPFQFNLLEVVKYRLTGRRKKFDVFSLHHPIFYTPKTLTRIFKKHGFSCISLRVFERSRYSAHGITGHLKGLMWLIASMFDQGVMIEAVFEKSVKKP